MARVNAILRARLEGRQFAKDAQILKKNIDDVDKSAGKMNKRLGDGGNQAGIAGAAVAELGRTISDLPYGLNAVTNNVSQLGSMFSLLVVETGSTRKAFDAMIDVMRGPAGILILFQTGIALLEYFTNAQNSTTKSVSKLGEAVATSAMNLKLAKDALEDENVAIEEKQQIVDALNKLYPDFNIQLSNSGDISEDNVKKIDNEISALERLAKAKAYQTMIEELYGDIAKIQSAQGAENISVMEALKASFLGVGNAARGLQVTEMFDEQKVKKIRKQIENLKKGLKEEGLVDLLLTGEDKKTNVDKQTRKRVKELVTKIYGFTYEVAQEERKKAAERFARVSDPIEDLIFGDTGEGRIERLRTQQELRALTLEEGLMMTQDVMSSFSDFFSASAQREIDIETNKTNAINEKLRERLRNENLSAEERKRINSRIAKNDAQLIAKQNELEEKRFKQQKAANIANAIINTYLAANQALANPMQLNPVAKAVSVAAVIAMGLANVAAIAKQKFVARTTPSGGGGSGIGSTGGAPQTPDFNVVGASQLNQVAAAVAGQQERPIRTYVVASDVSTAQELDRNILSEASIG